MPEKKNRIIEEFGNLLPGMSETEKTYLMGFLEGFAAMAGVSKQDNEPKQAGK